MQTTSQETQALTAAEQAAREKRHEFIYLICFLEADEHAQTLTQQRRAIWKRNGYRNTPYSKALSHGTYALNDIAAEHARKLTKDGKLLFAFPDTTVLRGVAA